MKKTILIVSFILFVFCLFLFSRNGGLLVQLAGLAKESVGEIVYNQYIFPARLKKFQDCKKK